MVQDVAYAFYVQLQWADLLLDIAYDVVVVFKFDSWSEIDINLDRGIGSDNTL